MKTSYWLALCASLFLIINIFSSPASADWWTLQQAKATVQSLEGEKSLEWFKQLSISLSQLEWRYRQNPQLTASLKDLNEVVLGIVQKKQAQYSPRRDFITTHGKNITWKLSIQSACFTHYDAIDKVAKELNFPTALILAMWSKETNCGLANAANGYGPFQITSRYYKPGPLTIQQFEQVVREFIYFSQNKINHYNSNATLKNRFWLQKVSISYSAYTLRDIQMYAILYNWAAKGVTLDNSTFANSNLHQWVQDAKRDWIVTKFIKILKWEVENGK